MQQLDFRIQDSRGGPARSIASRRPPPQDSVPRDRRHAFGAVSGPETRHAVSVLSVGAQCWRGQTVSRGPNPAAFSFSSIHDLPARKRPRYSARITRPCAMLSRSCTWPPFFASLKFTDVHLRTPCPVMEHSGKILSQMQRNLLHLKSGRFTT